MAAISNSVVLDEDVEEDYEPTEEGESRICMIFSCSACCCGLTTLFSKEILEYATWLGMDCDEDPDLLWIAKEGIKAPLPDDWKPCKSSSGSVYYFNIITGESK
jgi:centrosomal protein CEP164